MLFFLSLLYVIFRIGLSHTLLASVVAYVLILPNCTPSLAPYHVSDILLTGDPHMDIPCMAQTNPNCT